MEAREPWDPKEFVRHYDERAAELGIPPFPVGDTRRLKEEEEEYAYLKDQVTTLREFADVGCRIEHHRATQEPWDFEKFVRCYNAVVDEMGSWYYEGGSDPETQAKLEKDYRFTGYPQTIAEYARACHEYDQRF